MSLARRKDLAMLALGVLVILVDQLTKAWIVSYFASGRPPVQLLGPVLELDYLQNPGVAFSLFTGDGVKYALIAAAIAVIGYMYWKTRETASLLLKLSFGLVLGGAIGNLIDRFRFQYVVDFIHFQIPGIFNFAVFNIADSAICVGVFLLAFLLWRSSLENDAAAPSTQTTQTATLAGSLGFGARLAGKRVSTSEVTSTPTSQTPTTQSTRPTLTAARRAEGDGASGGTQATSTTSASTTTFTQPFTPGSTSGER